jgi:hypothetical protein
MKKALLSCLFVVLIAATAGFAEPKGESALDVHISVVNNDALRNMDTFMGKMHQAYGASRSVVESLMNTHKLNPGEVYMTFWLSQITKRQPVYVADTYKKNRGKGWGVIAKQLGIKPGSAEFHALKRGDGPFKDIDGPGQGKGKGKNKKKKWED